MKKFIIYGIGKMGRAYVDYCMERGAKDLKLTDSNSALWGTEYRGIKISNPSDILWEEYDFVITPVNDEHREEIFHCLKKNTKSQKKKFYLIVKRSYYQRMKFIIWEICFLMIQLNLEKFMQEENWAIN